MIESFKHKGLRQLFEDDNPRGINAEHVRKIKQIWPCSTQRKRSKPFDCRRSVCIR
jgi:plasmid maintenance system killer protein